MIAQTQFLDRTGVVPCSEFLEQEEVRIIQTPFLAPNCNAQRSASSGRSKEECLNRVIPLGERHLRRTIADFMSHYHHERNDQGISNELIHPLGPTGDKGPVRRRQRMRGC
jgi:hypothetical protein